jgi:bifunctional non-homologous end joining protein LigD
VLHEDLDSLTLRSTILDGEVVALDDQGIPRFELLQKWQKQPTAPLVYYVFDLLWHDGRNWKGKNVLQRRNQLRKIIKPDTSVQVGGFIARHGIELFRLAKEKGLEGIIAKRAASTYQAGRRSPDWLKIKARLQQEFVIGGFTEGKGSRKQFGALLLGAYEDGKFRYFGHSGSGFSDKMIKEILKQLRPLFTGKSPFNNSPEIPERIQWVKPELVCEVAFAEWTSDGQMRQTTFLGLRPDKNPKEVALERL